MAENWHKLGFIIQKPSDGFQPIYVEVDREDPHPKPPIISSSYTDSPGHSSALGLALPKPDNPPGSKSPTVDNIETLRDHLQHAMAVELSTIPSTVARLLSVSQPGQLCPLISWGEWQVIVRLEKLLPARLDEPMRQRLLNELFEVWLPLLGLVNGETLLT